MKIGIIGAMEVEVSTLKEAMKVDRVVTKAGMNFYEGMLLAIPAVVVQCGVGKVNAAMCVQILADLFQVTHVLNTGVAGSLNADLDIGDILVSEKAVQHDVDVSPLGYQLGKIPGFESREFDADKRMADAIIDACKRANPDVNIVKGRVVSGDQFISDNKVKEHLISEFQGDCAEMEGAAIAQASVLNGIPFAIVRAISDKADGSAEMDYPTFESQAAVHCANLVMEFVKSF
ncbi:5'-methylthioadenosine/S-adenosylhomocysteine nucleosidase [Eubacterium plexicaudatum ASF492]|uniref:adenosylhomocysteine nucleosidase n=1 Tax=Eubacterium plexicaudatum ASF492 TaxID=1235802 RepID=N2A8U9_9FIRM|nr:5'-methylthioadenosine/S-adenosylhomocysteine nucleosidase [Eubacterium plexicaudatum ASF492]